MKNLNKAWRAYRKNFFEILKAIIIRDGLSFLIFLIGAYLLLIGFGDANIIWPFLISAYISSTVLHGGFVKMCYESLRGKTTVKTMFKTTKKRGWSILGANIIVAVIMFTVLIFVIGASTFIYDYFYSNILLLSLIFITTLLLFLLFSFVNQAVVIDNIGSVRSLKKSVEVSSKIYKKMISLFVIIFVMLLIVRFSLGLIPTIGLFLDLIFSHFVIVPLMVLALTSLYVEGKKIK